LVPATASKRQADLTMTYQVRLSKFEGPLDLLLHLIRRDKIDIYDIPISHITREYLSYIEVMQELELEIAGEFFVMAATLMRIKAQMLLPRHIEEEEEEDPREELVRSLIEYRKYKEAAQHFGDRERERRKVFARPSTLVQENAQECETISVTLFDLVEAFKNVLDNLKKQVSYRVVLEEFSVEEKIELLNQRLESKSEILFTELFTDKFDKFEVIVTFLAVLELIRIGRIIARQMSFGADIWLYRPKDTPRVEVGDNISSDG